MKHYKDATRLINWVVMPLQVIVLVVAIGATASLYMLWPVIEAGRAACAPWRPAADYYLFCNPLSDGPACTHEMHSRVSNHMEWIDYKCAQMEPDDAFVFRVVDSKPLLEETQYAAKE